MLSTMETFITGSATLRTNGSNGNESLFKENFWVKAFVGVIDSKLIMFAESRDVITDGPERGNELWQLDGNIVPTHRSPSVEGCSSNENIQHIMNGAQFYFAGTMERDTVCGNPMAQLPVL